MKKHIAVILTLMATSVVAGCGGSGTNSMMSPQGGSTSSISGKVADGYLVGATVFLDKNGNYQMDSGEPSATTDQNGAYILNVNPADIGKYPIVAIATKGVTVDKDTGTTVQNSYVLSMPATAVTGIVNSNFISPMSTLIREKMATNPSITMADAKTQLRNQMNLPDGIDMMADYVAGSQTGTSTAQYQTMHTAAQQMVGVMGSQMVQVMTGNNLIVGRYRSMMGTINSNMSAIASNVMNGQGMYSTFMTTMMNQMQTQLGTMPVSSGFINYSGMFRNMTSHSNFWSNTGTPMSPMSGSMMIK